MIISDDRHRTTPTRHGPKNLHFDCLWVIRNDLEDEMHSLFIENCM